MPKHYVLFTDNDLDEMKNGKEIKQTIKNGEVLYFMSSKHFGCGYNEPSKNDWLEAKMRLFTTYDWLCYGYFISNSAWSGDDIDELILLRGLKKRYENGERSKELYDAIMKITKKRYI